MLNRIAIPITAGILLFGASAWGTTEATEPAEMSDALPDVDSEPAEMSDVPSDVDAEAAEMLSDAESEPGPPALPQGQIVRATFTTDVLDREPQDSVEQLGNENVQVLYFTEVRDAEGDHLVHRWEWNGTVMAEVPFDIGGPRWRIYSSKALDPSWVGEWTVVTVDSAGRELQRDTFVYTEAETSADSAPPASPQP